MFTRGPVLDYAFPVSMNDVIIAPLLAGLSVGVYCFTYCIPFIAPYLVSDTRTTRENVAVFARFIIGRLVGYIAFGALVGFLGEKINNDAINVFLIISLMLLSVLMLLHSLGLLSSERFGLCAKIKKIDPKFPLIMGLLMGINICPPFLMSLAYVFTLHSVAKGILYFLMFFIGTSVYLLPVFFLAFLGKIKEFQLVGRISAFVVGIIFLVYSIYSLTRSWSGLYLFKHY